jgi:hypothetical protein
VNSYQNALAHQGNRIIHYRMDMWVSRQQLAEMRAWCHKTLAPGDWDLHRHCEYLLGEGAVVTRFYFLNEDDARAFGERCQYQSPPRERRNANLERQFL